METLDLTGLPYGEQNSILNDLLLELRDLVETEKMIVKEQEILFLEMVKNYENAVGIYNNSGIVVKIIGIFIMLSLSYTQWHAEKRFLQSKSRLLGHVEQLKKISKHVGGYLGYDEESE